MGTIARALRKYTDLKNELPAIIRETVQDHKDEILDINKEQMRRGINSKGAPIGSYINKQYQAKKQAMNPLAGGKVDGILTGVMQQGLFIEVVGNILEFETSGDIKSKVFISRYSPDYLGLTDDNREKFIRNTLRPAFIKKIKQFLSK